VSLSSNSERPSHRVARYLKDKGYRIFREAKAVPRVVAQAMYVGAKAIWMQEGIVHEAAAAHARQAGMAVVMDHCMMKEHRRIMRRGR
jgi:predicted CoA-binding protein